MFVIRDIVTEEFYRKSCGRTGWYGPDLGHARVYQSEAAAHRVIEVGNHHVTYPGNRSLEVVPLAMILT